MNCGQVDCFCGCQLPVFRQNWSALRLIRSKLDGCAYKFGHVQSNPQFRMKKVSRSFHLCNLVEWHGLSGVGDLNLGRVFVVSHVFNTPEPVLTIATHVQIQCDKSEHVQHAKLHPTCLLLKRWGAFLDSWTTRAPLCHLKPLASSCFGPWIC